jgi:hypothetical protein
MDLSHFYPHEDARERNYDDSFVLLEHLLDLMQDQTGDESQRFFSSENKDRESLIRSIRKARNDFEVLGINAVCEF